MDCELLHKTWKQIIFVRWHVYLSSKFRLETCRPRTFKKRKTNRTNIYVCVDTRVSFLTLSISMFSALILFLIFNCLCIFSTLINLFCCFACFIFVFLVLWLNIKTNIIKNRKNYLIQSICSKLKVFQTTIKYRI